MRSRDFLAVTSLYMLAFAVRLIPFTITTLPYNIDAYPLIRISNDIITSGHWGIGGEDLIFYNSKMPAFSMILSTFSMVFGIEPFALVSILVPIITSTSVIAIYMLTMKITKSALTSYIAGLFFALSGFYLYLTTAIMKETIGLTLMPIIFYLFMERSDPRKRILAAMFLILLPFIHHLTALVVFTVIGFMVITDNHQAWKSKGLQLRNLALDFFLGPFLFVFTYAYYDQVRMEQFAKVVNFDQGILFLSVFVIFTVFALILSTRVTRKAPFVQKQKKKAWLRIFDEKIVIVIIPIGLLILNHYVKIFAGTLNTSTEFLQMAIPYLVLVIAGFIGFNLIRNTETRYRAPIVSIFLGTITVMSFGFLRGLDPFSLDLIYRSYDYLDIGLAVCIGVGFVYMMKPAIENERTPGHERKKDGEGDASERDEKVHIVAGKSGRLQYGRKVAVALIAFVLMLSTVPLAFSGEILWDIRDTTEEREFAAMRFMNETAGNGSVGTDQRMADIAHTYFDIDSNQTFPWLFGKITSLGFDYLLLEDEWKSVGAQMYPFENEVIEEDEFDSLLDSADVIYAAGSGDVVYILKVGD